MRLNEFNRRLMTVAAVLSLGAACAELTHPGRAYAVLAWTLNAVGFRMATLHFVRQLRTMHAKRVSPFGIYET